MWVGVQACLFCFSNSSLICCSLSQTPGHEHVLCTGMRSLRLLGSLSLFIPHAGNPFARLGHCNHYRAGGCIRTHAGARARGLALHPSLCAALDTAAETRSCAAGVLAAHRCTEVSAWGLDSVTEVKCNALWCVLVCSSMYHGRDAITLTVGSALQGCRNISCFLGYK